MGHFTTMACKVTESLMMAKPQPTEKCPVLGDISREGQGDFICGGYCVKSEEERQQCELHWAELRQTQDGLTLQFYDSFYSSAKLRGGFPLNSATLELCCNTITFCLDLAGGALELVVAFQSEMEAKFWSDMVVCWQCNQRVVENCIGRRQEVLDDLQHRRDKHGFHDHPLLSRLPMEEQVDPLTNDGSVSDCDSDLSVDVIEDLLRQAEGPARNEARRPSSVEPVGRESGAFLVEQFETQTDDIEKILEHMQVERYVRRRAHNKIASPSSLVSDSLNVVKGMNDSSVGECNCGLSVDAIEDILRQAETNQDPATNEARRHCSLTPDGRDSGARVVDKFETQTDEIEQILQFAQVERYVSRKAHNKIESPSSLAVDSNNVEEEQRKSSSTDREQEARTMAEFPQEAGDCQANEVTACVSSHSGGGTSRTGHCEASKLGTPSDADTDSGNLGPLAYGGRFGGSQIYSNTLPFGLRGN